MKIYIRYFFTALSAVLLLLTGCSKSFTEKTPSDAIPLNEALNSETNLQAALNGLYSTLRSSNLFGCYLIAVGDVLADNAFIEVNNSGRFLSQYQYNSVSDDFFFSSIWQTAYTGIMRANLIINATPTGDGVSQIKAQAQAVRALLYFKLVNLYARPYTDNPDGLGVPLVLTYDPYKLPVRNTVREVYAKIVNDLEEAFAAAPDYTSSITISKYAVESLLAKVHLYMGNNTAAKTAAADVINNSGFTLVPAAGYAAFWANPRAQSGMVESLFEVDADEVNNNNFEDLGSMYYNGYQDLYCSMQLYDLFTATDVRKSLLVPGVTKGGAPAIIVTKFPNVQSKDKDNNKVMRLAELYLIAAEASLPTGEGDARTFLNVLAQQRDPSFTGYTAATTGANLLNAIVLERRKELAFEGDRFFDLNRLKLPVERSENTGAIPAGSANSNLVIPYSSTYRIAPIPQAEIQANPAIASQQNPGY